MNINIIAGGCGEINNKHIFSLLKNRDKTKNHIIIAPDRCQFNIEQRLFEELDEKCFFDINVMSLTRLSKTVLKNNNKNILKKQSGVALVKKLLEDNKNSLSVFKKATSYVGFANSLFETICFYKSCNISPEEMFVDDSVSFANLKQKDIKLIYSKYEDYLQSDFTDSFNQLKLFAELIKKDTFANTIFYFIEFDDFTRLMYEIIYKLAKFSDGIYLTCTYGKGKNNYNLYNNKVYYDLIDLFRTENLEYKINKLSGYEDAKRNYLLENLLSYSSPKSEEQFEDISLKSFDNIKDEVKFTLADIYSKIIIKKDNLSNFAIVVPSILEYKQYLITELNKYDMPYYFDESGVLIDNYLIRLIFDICEIIKGNYRYPEFSVVLKSPLLNFDSNAVSDYDNYLKRICAMSDMCLRAEKTDNNDIKDFILFIKTTRDESKSASNYSECVEIIDKIFEYINLRIENYISTFNNIEKRLYQQVLNKYSNINRDILSVFGNVATTFTNFLDIYKAYFEATSITMPPISSNTLFIADFSTSYITCYDYLYILGNNDGKMPDQKLDNGLVTDEELAKLPNAKKLTPTIEMLNNRKVFKLFDMIFKYRKEINLSYPAGNMEGKLYPSNMIESLKKILGVDVKNYSNILDVVNDNYERIKESNVVFNNLTEKIAEENLIAYSSSWDIYNSSISYRQVLSSLYDVINSCKKDLISTNKETIIPRLINNNFFSSGYTSVSQLESYNRCPYYHFVKYGLKLQDTTNTKLNPMDIGNLIHEVLSKIVPVILLKSKSIEELKTLASNELDKIFKRDNYSEIVENKDNTYIIKALYRELDRVVVAVTKEIESSNFKPKYYEYGFEKILKVDGINIKGFIDRIDVKDDGFIVIDYKTGDNHFSNYNDVYSGKKLQLLVYANAFKNKSGLKCKGAFYLPISNTIGEENSYRFNGVMLKTDSNVVDIDSNLAYPNCKSSTVNLTTTTTGKIKDSAYYKNMCISQEDFDYLLTFAMQQVEKSIRNIRNGDISPRPIKEKGKSTCTYCDYKALCGFSDENCEELQTIETIEKLKEINNEDGGI